MGYWARTPQARGQQILFSTTVDDVIPPEHPVRLFAELLDGFDWTSWESPYHGHRGKPPIHPRVLAALWLYGLRRGIRSSRKLEYMARYRVDFLWLAEGPVPDHSTLSNFRLPFGDQLQDFFRHVLRVAMAAGLLRWVDVATDGTRVKASNSRFETWTAEKIAAVIDEMTAAFEQKLGEARQNDGREDDLFGEDSTDTLPPELADLKVRREKLEQIQRDLKAADDARRKEGIDPAKNPAQIPKHDPDSRVLPNQEGGYAPNDTPLCTTEGESGFLIDCPPGHAMPYEETSVLWFRAQTSRGEKSTWDVDRCGACDGCPLKPRGVSPSNKGGRTASRDAYAPQREQLAAKRRGDPAQKKYDQRLRIAETPLALIKQVLGLRPFLLRGLTKVKREWLWTCTAVNLDKLARGLARLRTELAVNALM